MVSLKCSGICRHDISSCLNKVVQGQTAETWSATTVGRRAIWPRTAKVLPSASTVERLGILQKIVGRKIQVRSQQQLLRNQRLLLHQKPLPRPRAEVRAKAVAQANCESLLRVQQRTLKQLKRMVSQNKSRRVTRLLWQSKL
jgi:hypothetical protein